MKRDKLEIIAQILDICKEKSCKTRIVYDANMNFTTIGPYLKILIDEGLVSVKYEGGTWVYKVTRKGDDISLKINNLMQIVSKINSDIRFRSDLKR